MIWTGILIPFQAAADLSDPLHTIALAQTVTAVGTAILALLGIGIAIAAFVALRAVARTLVALQRTVDQLVPRTEPLLERATQLADDAAAVGQRLRQEAERVAETIEDLNEQLRSAVDTFGERGRHFGAVLKVVQDEVEEILLDATATARGLQAVAGALQRPVQPDPMEPRDGEGE